VLGLAIARLGALSCLVLSRIIRERCRTGRFPPGLSASREETSRLRAADALAWWNALLGGSLPWSSSRVTRAVGDKGGSASATQPTEVTLFVYITFCLAVHQLTVALLRLPKCDNRHEQRTRVQNSRSCVDC
jgi:hypothetical protein